MGRGVQVISLGVAMKAVCKAHGAQAQPCRGSLDVSVLSSFTKSKLTIVGAVALAALALSPMSAQASSTFVQLYDLGGHPVCGPTGKCDRIVSSQSQTYNPPTFHGSVSGAFITAAGEVSPGTIKAFHTASNPVPSVSTEFDLGFNDVFTVHGTGTGLVSVTATLRAIGEVHPDANHNLIAGGASIYLGTYGELALPISGTYSIVNAFDSAAQAFTPQYFFIGNAGVQLFDIVATHTFVVPIGGQFNLAAELLTGIGIGGAIDASHTATLSFTTPSGVTLTSELGFGVAVVTPVPAALPLFASGLGVLAWASRRKRKSAAAA